VHQNVTWHHSEIDERKNAISTCCYAILFKNKLQVNAVLV